MALDPPLILADEPTAQLDFVRADEIVQLLRVLAAGDRVVVVATHDTRIVPLADIELSPAGAPVRAPQTRPPQTPIRLGPGAVLLDCGSVEDLIYVVTDGEVEISAEPGLSGGGVLQIGRPDDADVVGEPLGPMVRIPRGATVRASVVSYTVEAFRQRFGDPPAAVFPNEPISTR